VRVEQMLANIVRLATNSIIAGQTPNRLTVLQFA